MKVVAIYPGTFDPITKGRVDLVERGSRMFDKLILSIAANPGKSPLFSLEERMELAASALSHIDKVEIHGFSSLLVEFASSVGANVIVKGLRRMRRSPRSA